MKLLAIETATEACSAALMVDGETCERFEIAPRRHAELILSMMDGLLAEAGLGLQDLDALAFGRGPGSFTGVRIAAGVIQGAAFGAELPVVPVSTLAALAQGAVRETDHTHVLAAIDARMREVYWGAYVADAKGIVRLQGEESVCPASNVQIPDDRGWMGCGTGWQTCGSVLRNRLGTALTGQQQDGRLPHARDVAILGTVGYAAGRAVDAGEAIPVYLRDRVVARR